MVYIAPLPSTNKQKQHKAVAHSTGSLPKANTGPQQQRDSSRLAGKQARNQHQANGKGFDVQRSKKDLLQELTRQAEWNTLVLQREQAALRALQESQTGTLAAQASAQALAGAALDIIEPHNGLAPVATRAKNHRFFDVAPKQVDSKQVPGLSPLPAAAVPADHAGRQQVQGTQQQQQAGIVKGAAPPAAARQCSPVRPQQRAAMIGRVAATAASAAPAARVKQQQGCNVQRQQRPGPAGRAVAAKAQALVSARFVTAGGSAADQADTADGDWQEQHAVDIDGQLSPFAAADWHFEYPDAGLSQGQQPQLGILGQTFPDSPQFKSGMVFDIPAEALASADGQHTVQPYSSSGAAVAAHIKHASPGSYAGAHIPLAQLVELQQQQQGNGWLGINGGHPPPGAYADSSTCTVQQQQQHQSVQAPLQPQQLLQPCHTVDELAEAMRVAQAYPDPLLRSQLVKELKQKLYKLELEQQIAEREAARQAAKAAAAAREAAEEAARAAAPPPWDPLARAHRLGGGGEPLLSMDGMPVADLRAMRGRLPVPGAESSQTFSTGQQQLVVQLPAGLSSGQAAQLMQSVASPAGMVTAAHSNVTPQRVDNVTSSVAHGAAAPAAAPAAGKGFLVALNELKAGPSLEQRAAASAARQKLLDDLQSQVAEKAARTAAEAAAEAARTAQEEEALRRYYSQQQASQNPVAQHPSSQGLGFSNHNALNPQAWVLGGGALGSSQPSGSFGSGAASCSVMLQPLAAEASNRAYNAVAAADTGGHVRKGRSKKVIEAPWLDRLQQQGQVTQQQRSQPGLKAQSSSYGVCAQVDQQPQQQLNTSRLQENRIGVPTAQQSEAALDVAGNAAATSDEQLSSHQLATALQELQQQQTLMWEEFTWQTKALERLLQDEQAPVADSNTAWAKLQRVRNVLQKAQEQQQALQQMLNDRQQQQQQEVTKPRRQRRRQQQEGLPTQQHSTVQMQQQQPGQSMSDELEGDSLDAFMVETQLVPVTVNTIPESPGVGDSLMQLMLPPSAAGYRSSSNPRQPVQHFNRYATYGPDAELSSCSLASNLQHSKASARASSNPVWGQWPSSQQQLSNRSPASPPILRSDRFADKLPGSKHAGGSGADGNATHKHGKGSGGGSSGPAHKTKSRVAAAGGGNSTARRPI